MGKYAGVTKYLVAAAEHGHTEMTVPFDGLDVLVPGGLPPSARKYREWWANSGQPHSSAWREAGWRVDAVNQGSGMWVRFRLESVGSAARGLGIGRAERPRAPIGFARSRPAVAEAAATPNPIPQDAEVDRLEARLMVDWRQAGEVTLDETGRLVFPELPNGPGIYRFRLIAGEGQMPARVYIGEAESLSHRMKGYRTPGPTQTST